MRVPVPAPISMMFWRLGVRAVFSQRAMPWPRRGERVALVLKSPWRPTVWIFRL
jgi:hypothetical protein